VASFDAPVAKLVVCSAEIDGKNKLYFGDNLQILRENVADASVDLIYLDPPFNSNASYNVLLKKKSDEESDALITAPKDTWQWGLEGETVCSEIILGRSPARQGFGRFRRILQNPFSK
jgi:16S rRNA G966 N2-methylase RsmD